MNQKSHAVQPPKRLAHIALRTNQLPAMVEWYCTVLGAHVAYGAEDIAFLTYDEEHHRIALLAMAQYAEKPEPISVGHVHTAFAYDTLAEMLETYVKLKELSIYPVRTINHGPTVSLYYADPDGNQVELQVDSFPDAKATNEWMRSEAFKRNPIGIEFDPDKMLEQLQAGASDIDLMRRPDSL